MLLTQRITQGEDLLAFKIVQSQFIKTHRDEVSDFDAVHHSSSLEALM